MSRHGVRASRRFWNCEFGIVKKNTEHVCAPKVDVPMDVLIDVLMDVLNEAVRKVKKRMPIIASCDRIFLAEGCDR